MKKKILNLFNYILAGSIFFSSFICNTFAADGDVSCGNDLIAIPSGVVKILHNGYLLIKIGTPLVLIATGILDFGRAVMGADESEIKKKQSRFVKRVISAAMVFLVLYLVEFIMDILVSVGFMNAKGCIQAILG